MNIIISSDEKVEFPWFKVEQDGDADACCTFISMLCEFAKNHLLAISSPQSIRDSASDKTKYSLSA